MSPPPGAFSHFLLSDWILKRVPGGLLVELVLLCQSVCFWHPLAASPSLLWAFQTIEAQTGLNCCIFSECPFVTVQWPIFFFSNHRADGEGLPSHRGEWLREGSSGQWPGHMLTWVVLGLYGLPSFYRFHTVTGALLRRIRWCQLLWFTCY